MESDERLPNKRGLDVGKLPIIDKCFSVDSWFLVASSDGQVLISNLFDGWLSSKPTGGKKGLFTSPAKSFK